MMSSSMAARWLPEVPFETKDAAAVKPPPGNFGLPEIRVNGRELRDVSAEALEALNAANAPAKLFVRAGSIVRIDRAEDGRPMIVPVTDVHLRGEMTRAANFHKIPWNGEPRPIAVSLPMDAARDILSRPVDELGFPPLEAIAEAPFVRSDDTIVSEPGYDAATRTFYSPVGDMVYFFVPDRPTADDVDGARAIIEDVLCDFPFADEASRANAFALMITPEIRHAIGGNVPMALVDAPQAGSGKTLLVSVVFREDYG